MRQCGANWHRTRYDQGTTILILCGATHDTHIQLYILYYEY